MPPLNGVADPHHIDPDPDTACHPDPDSASPFDGDPDPTFQFEADYYY